MRDVLRNAETMVPLDRMASTFSAAYLKPLLVSACPAPQHERAIASMVKSARPTLGVLARRPPSRLTDRSRLWVGSFFVAKLTRRSSSLANVSTRSESWRPDLFSSSARSRVMSMLGSFGNIALESCSRHIGPDASGWWTSSERFADGKKHTSTGPSALWRKKTAATCRWIPRICLERVALEVAAWLLNEPIDRFLSEQRQVVCVGRSTRRPKRRLGREGAPLGQRGGAPLFVSLAGDEMALLIEMVVDLGMNRAEFLQRLHASKPLHGPFSSSKRLMRILGAIVEPTTGLPAIGVDLFIAADKSKPVGDDSVGVSP